MPDHGAEYERHQIESLLGTKDGRLDRDVGMYLSPEHELFEQVHDIAVAPALRSNGINKSAIVRVFGSESLLSDVCLWVQTARVVVADLTATNADLMYVLGLCHGLRRCPLLIMQENTEVPFNLGALRCVEYAYTNEGLWTLREQLERAIRIVLATCGDMDQKD
jgi:hypothetical protein